MSPSHSNTATPSTFSVQQKKDWIHQQALELGFADCGFLSVHDPIFEKQITHLQVWLAKNYEGQLAFMHENHELRADPSKLVEGSKTIISVRMDYLTEMPKRGQRVGRIADDKLPNNAIIARYARGRDYHKVMRGRLKKLAKRIEAKLPEWELDSQTTDTPFVFRPFADSAPIFERAIASQVGLGWTGKHTLLINKDAGSFFVLGELFISLDLSDETMPNDGLANPVEEHCGTCTSCLDACPTNAIVAPYEVNASACISYLTIELKGSIPNKYRKAIGNRVFGCDDCQVVCPWNRYAQPAVVDDFAPRNGTNDITLIDLWHWTAEEFDKNTQGSPIRRTGYVNFLRNIAIGIGNAPQNISNIEQLKQRLGEFDGEDGDMLDEHIEWAIHQQNAKMT